jgi:hypothetical protein
VDDQEERLAEADRPEGLSFEAYRSARERFLARLRADSEVRRLEALWRDDAPAPRA